MNFLGINTVHKNFQKNDARFFSNLGIYHKNFRIFIALELPLGIPHVFSAFLIQIWKHCSFGSSPTQSTSPAEPLRGANTCRPLDFKSAVLNQPRRRHPISTSVISVRSCLDERL